MTYRQWQKASWGRTTWDLCRDDVVLTEKEAERINAAQVGYGLEDYHLLWCIGDEGQTLQEITLDSWKGRRKKRH